MAKSKNSMPALVAVAVIALALGAYFQQLGNKESPAPEFEKAILLPKPKPVVDVEFTDHNGDDFTQEQLLGRWSIVFFGFTNCPDVCPTTMHILKQVKNKLVQENAWGSFQVLMVSVDPKRDTAQQLANYVPYFDAEFIGIRSSLEVTVDFAKQLGILFFADEAAPDGSYDVDHGTSIILLNPKGEMAGVISAPHQADIIARDLTKLSDYFHKDHKQWRIRSAKIINDKNIQEASKIDLVEQNNLSLVARNGWIRAAPFGVSSLAGYVDLVNTSDKDIVISHLSSPLFDEVMIHQTSINEGIASMNHMDELLIPADGTVSLKPMDTHFMLLEPIKELLIGQEVILDLNSKSGDSYQIVLVVGQQP